jgi:hypothetical protein
VCSSDLAEIRRHAPPGDVDMRASAAQRLGDPRQRLPTVDQYLERAARSRRRIARGPQRPSVRRLQLIDPADTPQTAMMMRTDRGLDALTCPPIGALNQSSRHPQSLPAALHAQVRVGGVAGVGRFSLT